LSSLIRHGANVVVFLINNGGYTIERMLVEGPFNDIQAWNYPALLEAFGGKSRSEIVRTEEDLESALQRVSQSQNHDVKLVEIDVSKKRLRANNGESCKDNEEEDPGWSSQGCQPTHIAPAMNPLCSHFVSKQMKFGKKISFLYLD
jgi:TPP-dependent 2-oxoacid decarboxylase